MRYAARVDVNQPDIVKALRQIGAEVNYMHQLGQGTPDLLISFRQRWYVIECKSDDGELNDEQKRWIGRQKAPVYTVRSPEEAVEFLQRETPDWLLGITAQAMSRTHICRDAPDDRKAGAANELHGSLESMALQTLQASWRSRIKMSCSEVCERIGASKASGRVEKVLRKLWTEGVIKREGNNRSTVYWAEEKR